MRGGTRPYSQLSEYARTCVHASAFLHTRVACNTVKRADEVIE